MKVTGNLLLAVLFVNFFEDEGILQKQQGETITFSKW